MFGSAILEVTIGVVFVFLLMSVICSAIREGIEAWMKTRAAFLEYGIRELLHDKKAEGLAKSFYSHPLIYGLFSNEYKPGNEINTPNAWTSGSGLPSYIPAKNFALTLMDIAARGPATDVVSSDPNSPKVTLNSIRINIGNIGNPAIQRVLLTAIDSAQGDLLKAQKNIMDWYDSAMDRVSGQYKRSTQWVIFWIGLFTAIVMNINTITIADFLYRNDAIRAVIVERVTETTGDDTSENLNYADARKELDLMGLPIGWANGWGAPRQDSQNIFKVDTFQVWNHLLGPVLGWLVTALAASLGAPFWFDILNKVMVIRSTVKPHEKSPEEASEDRQFPVNKNNLPSDTSEVQRPVQVIETYPPTSQAPLFSTPRDSESSLDGCRVTVEILTPDEDLPAAKGGVE